MGTQEEPRQREQRGRMRVAVGGEGSEEVRRHLGGLATETGETRSEQV